MNTNSEHTEYIYVEEKGTYVRFQERARSKGSVLTLYLWSFLESVFFPIPVDPALAAVVLAERSLWLRRAIIVAFWSVIGGVAGYIIGYALFATIGDWIITTFHLQEELAVVGGYFREQAFVAVLISAFTPIPYKVFTIGAGLFHVSFPAFLAASIIGRTARFVAVAYIVARFGKRVMQLVLRYFKIITLVVVAFVLLWVLVR